MNPFVSDEDCSGKKDQYLFNIIKQLETVKTTLDLLCDCFLLRAHDEDPDPLWHSFYNIQMRHYLAAKKSMSLSAPEGDMVHDLIKDAWNDVRDYMEKSVFGPVSNIECWFKTIRIDFPVDENDPNMDTFFNHDLSMCQNDTKNMNLKLGV